MIDRRIFIKWALGCGIGSLLDISKAEICAGRQVSKQAQNTDILLIGSGPAALSIAHRLAGTGMKITIMESGFVRAHAETRKLAAVVPDGSGYPFDLQRACQRTVGGSSVIWGGLCPRLLPSDFRSGSIGGYGRDWPISHEELEPYYCEAERLLQVGSGFVRSSAIQAKCLESLASPYRRSSESLIRDLAAKGIGKTTAASVCRNAQGEYQPFNFKRRIAPAVMRDKNIVFMLGATVRRLVRKGDRVTGALYSTLEGKEGLLDSRIIIICGGGIQNARLLLLSADPGRPDGLGNGSGHVGKWFMEHPHQRLWIKASKGIKRKELEPTMVHSYYWYDGLKKKGLGAMLVRMQIYSDIPEWAMTEARPAGNILLDCLCEQSGLAANRITLDSQKKDQFGDLLPRLSYRLAPIDLQTLAEGRKMIEPLIDSYGGNAVSEPLGYGSHLIGTTRMSAKDSGGVVDRNLKVFGTDNLYVAGSSVFPSSGAANPTLTLSALSLRLADHIVQRHGKGKLTPKMGM